MRARAASTTGTNAAGMRSRPPSRAIVPSSFRPRSFRPRSFIDTPIRARAPGPHRERRRRRPSRAGPAAGGNPAPRTGAWRPARRRRHRRAGALVLAGGTNHGRSDEWFYCVSDGRAEQMSMDGRIERSRLLYERALFESDAGALAEAERELDGVEADL